MQPADTQIEPEKAATQAGQPLEPPHTTSEPGSGQLNSQTLGKNKPQPAQHEPQPSAIACDQPLDTSQSSPEPRSGQLGHSLNRLFRSITGSANHSTPVV